MPEMKMLAVHVGCAVVIALCFVVASTVLKDNQMAANALEGLGWWLWGKLGFAPAKALQARLVERALQTMEPGEIARLSQRPASAEEVSQ